MFLKFKNQEGFSHSCCNSIRHRQFHFRANPDPRPRQRRLVNHRRVRPLRRRQIIQLPVQLCQIQPPLRLDLAQPDQIRHHVTGFARHTRNQHVHSRRRRISSLLGILQHHRVRRFIRHGHIRNLAHLQSFSQQLNPRCPQRVALQRWNLQLFLRQAQHHVRLLRYLHQHPRRRRLPHHLIDRQIAVHPIRHPQQQSLRTQRLPRLRHVLSHQVGHGYFAAVNRHAHRRNRAQKCRRRQDEHQKRHPAKPFQSFPQRHRPPWSAKAKPSLLRRKLQPPKPTAAYNSARSRILFLSILTSLLHYFFSSGAGYSGNFSLLVSALFTSNSSNNSDGAIIVCGTRPTRLLTSGSFPSAIKSFRNARTSSSLNTAPRTSSSCPSAAYTRYNNLGAFPGPSVSTR